MKNSKNQTDSSYIEVCPICECEVSLKDEVCPNCGNELYVNFDETENENTFSLIKCPACNHEVSSKAPFCPNCGHQIYIQPDSPIFMICPDCGHKVPMEANSCPNCGHALNKSKTVSITDRIISIVVIIIVAYIILAFC